MNSSLLLVARSSRCRCLARGLLLDPKLVLIDEPSTGLSPVLVQEVFSILKELRQKGEDTAPKILADPRIAQLFLGGGLAPAEAPA